MGSLGLFVSLHRGLKLPASKLQWRKVSAESRTQICRNFVFKGSASSEALQKYHRFAQFKRGFDAANQHLLIKRQAWRKIQCEKPTWKDPAAGWVTMRGVVVCASKKTPGREFIMMHFMHFMYFVMELKHIKTIKT